MVSRPSFASLVLCVLGFLSLLLLLPDQCLDMPTCRGCVDNQWDVQRGAVLRSVGFVTRGRYLGGRRPSSDDSFHTPTDILPLALDKPSITKRYHHRRTYCHTSPCSPTTVMLHDTRFVECRWRNDGWTVKTVGLHDTGPRVPSHRQTICLGS